MFPILFASAALIALVVMSADHSEPDLGEDWTYEDPPTSKDVIFAISGAILAQAPAMSQSKLRQILSRLIHQDGDSWHLVIPVDDFSSFDHRRAHGIARAVSDSMHFPVSIRDASLEGHQVCIVSAGLPLDDLSWLGRDEFGGVIDLIFNSFIATAVGTVTSLGVQDLVASAGGERRLARLMRHYKDAVARKDESAADRIRQRICRSASRIKGRRVDWSEVEALTK